MKYKVRTVTLHASEPIDSTKITYPEAAAEAARAVMEKFHLDTAQEHIFALALNSAKQITGFKVVCSGTQVSCPVDMRLFWRSMLVLGALSVIVVHNHPGGVLEMSDEDVHLTTSLIKSGDIIGIDVIDHVIITKDSFISIREKCNHLWR